MWIIGFLLVVTIVIFLIEKACTWDNEAGPLTAIGVVFVIMAAIVMGLTNAQCHDDIVRIQSVQQTADIARSTHENSIEGAAFRMKVSDMNADLASMKYWHSKWWLQGFIPDQVETLQPIH